MGMANEIDEFLRAEGAAATLLDSGKPNGQLNMTGQWSGRDRADGWDPDPIRKPGRRRRTGLTMSEWRDLLEWRRQERAAAMRRVHDAAVRSSMSGRSTG